VHLQRSDSRVALQDIPSFEVKDTLQGQAAVVQCALQETMARILAAVNWSQTPKHFKAPCMNAPDGFLLIPVTAQQPALSNHTLQTNKQIFTSLDYDLNGPIHTVHSNHIQHTALLLALHTTCTAHFTLQSSSPENKDDRSQTKLHTTCIIPSTALL
jgi:hypothetical protein